MPTVTHTDFVEALRLDHSGEGRTSHLVLHARADGMDKPGALFVGRRQRDPDCEARTRVDVGGPDTLRLGYETDDGTFEILAELDGRYLTTEVAGGFTGRVVGMYATRGTLAFD